MLNKIKNHSIHIGLVVILALLVIYLTSGSFRCFLKNQDIDPNFIIGFFTVIALLLSLIQNSNDRKYGYNSELVKSIEEKGLSIVSKLLIIKKKSLTYLGTIETINTVMGTGNVYQDTNDVMSKSDIERDMELVATYVDTFFPEIKTQWNSLIDILNEIGTLCNGTMLNYNENRTLINTPGFSNIFLDNINVNLERCREIDREIGQITLEMRNLVVEKINNLKGEFKKTFDFRL